MRLKRKGVLAFQNAGTPFLFNPKSGISDQHHIGKDCHAGQNTVSFCYCIINSKGIIISICEVLPQILMLIVLKSISQCAPITKYIFWL